MSTWDDRQITCMFCGEAFIVKVASGLHISRLPAVRDQVLRGELHRFECPKCRRKIEVRLPIIYTDFSRGHWIEIRPAEDLSQWRQVARACMTTFRRALERGSPLLREGSPVFKVRLVFGYDELREKIALWDAELDDVAIECLKLLAIRKDLSVFGFEDRLLVRVVDTERLTIDRHRGDKVAGTFTLDCARDDLGQARAIVEPTLDGAFSDPFVSINRVVGRYSVTGPS